MPNKQRKNSTRRNMRQRRRHGGAAVASLDLAAGLDAAYKPLHGSSLQQGAQFQEMTKQFHGGSATYPDALSGAPLIDSGMAASARTTPLDKAIGEIQGMSDMAGGRRKGRKGRKATRKGRKAGCKGRKASRKGRKATRKGRKASRKASRKGRSTTRKNRSTTRKNRKSQGGGALMTNPADYSKDGDFMLGINPQAAGLHKEWAEVASAGGGDYMAPRIQEVYRDDMPKL